MKQPFRGLTVPSPHTIQRLPEDAIRDWLSYSFAPMSLLHLLSKHNMSVGADMTAPFATLNTFWRRQMPQVDNKMLERVLSWLDDDSEHHLICQSSPQYPSLLNEISSPPRVLFAIGDVDLLKAPQLAIVGSRRASPYGLAQAQAIAAELSSHGWAICSGMAMGVDAAAHRAALANGAKTIAVLGSGVDVCYPPRQKELYESIQCHGVLVSEFVPGSPAKSDHFLRRNRIISGLSQGVVVVEATLRSGSLATASFAVEHNRMVYALPGPVSMSSFAGNHKLIQQGAALITGAEDVLADLPVLKSVEALEVLPTQPDIEGKSDVSRKHLANPTLLDNVGYETTSIDSLVSRTRLPVAALMDQLIALELDGWVTAVPGGYVRVRR